jgi:DNA-binding PadR family transcriptional regulator
LTPTARVILGMLRLGARTGYEIRSFVEISTRFFWGASYGQIYPELRRLAEAGLVEAEDDPRGGIQRRAYRLTRAGESALHESLTAPTELIFEYRDEALLRTFFGDVLSPDNVLENARHARDEFAEVVKRFREIEPRAQAAAHEGEVFPYVALLFGIGLMEWIAAWYAELERKLEAGEPLVPPPAPEA